MDYRIFNVCTYVIILMRPYTHGGWAKPTASQHNMLDSETRIKLYVLLDEFELGSWNVKSDAYQLSHPATAIFQLPAMVIELFVREHQIDFVSAMYSNSLSNYIAT